MQCYSKRAVIQNALSDGFTKSVYFAMFNVYTWNEERPTEILKEKPPLYHTSNKATVQASPPQANCT